MESNLERAQKRRAQLLAEFGECKVPMHSVYVLYENPDFNPKMRLFIISQNKPTLIKFLDNGEIIDTQPHTHAVAFKEEDFFWQGTYHNDDLKNYNTSGDLDIHNERVGNEKTGIAMVPTHKIGAYNPLSYSLEYNLVGKDSAADNFNAEIWKLKPEGYDEKSSTYLPIKNLVDYQNKVNELLEAYWPAPTRQPTGYKTELLDMNF